MATITSASPDWLPLSPSLFIVPGSSTALTVPNPNAQTPLIRMGGNMIMVALLIAQGVGIGTAAIWIRTDGAVVTAATTGGMLMNGGDTRTIYGVKAIQQVRVIQAAVAGALAVEYYLYRPQSA